MKIHYTGRKVEVTSGIMSLVEEKLNKMHKVIGPQLDLEAHVIFSVERHLRSTEVTLHLKNQSLAGLGSAPDPYSSVQNALDKLEKQVLRYKERVRGSKRHAISPRVAVAPGGVLERRAGLARSKAARKTRTPENAPGMSGEF